LLLSPRLPASAALWDEALWLLLADSGRGRAASRGREPAARYQCL